jgi:hypothetical protein
MGPVKAFSMVSAFFVVAVDVFITFGFTHGLTILAAFWLLMPNRSLKERT